MSDDFVTDVALPPEELQTGDTPPATGDDEGNGADQTLVTKEGLRKLKEELQELKTVRRQEVASRLKEAISYGDLSENAEYEEAKNEQAFVEGRILELEQKIKHAKIISEKKVDAHHKEIDIGSTVTLLSLSEHGENPETYTIVGSTEADPLDHKISNESPIGKALLARQKGDIIEVPSPSGVMKYEILQAA